MIYRMMVHNVSDPKSERLKSLKCPVCVSCGLWSALCVLVVVRRARNAALVKRCSSSLSLVAESERSGAVGPRQPGCAALAGTAGRAREPSAADDRREMRDPEL